MSSIQVRPFRRRDREQLTGLVNAHAAAVVPGQGVSVSALLSHLERQPGEAIVDPWVSERLTLVAEQQDRVVAAAHLLRYFGDERAGQAYRGTGEIHWLLFWPVAPVGNPCWPDATEAAGQLIAACIHQLDDWGVASQDAGGELPVPGIYGIPGQWPHISALYEQAGFAHTGDTEVVYLAVVDELAQAGQPPVPGLTVQRSVGMNGTRLSAVRARTCWATSRSRCSTTGSGCPGAAAGPTSAISRWPSHTGAAGWLPGCSARPRTGCGWPRSAGCWTTRRWMNRPPGGTGPSWPRPASRS